MFVEELLINLLCLGFFGNYYYYLYFLIAYECFSFDLLFYLVYPRYLINSLFHFFLGRKNEFYHHCLNNLIYL